MPITSYTELKTAIPTWFLDRSDLAAYADDFIDLAEAMLNAKLRCREMEATTTLTPVSNVCTLPSDYLEYKRVTEVSSVRRRLTYITEDAADATYPTRAAGVPRNFMMIGSSLTALPLSANDIELTYYQKVPALSGSVASNWLLAAHPGLYLHSCLLYAAEFAKNDDILVRETKWVETFLSNLADLDNRAKFGNAGVTLPGAVW